MSASRSGIPESSSPSYVEFWQTRCMAKPQLYDRIGHGYASARQADPHIARQVRDALGDVTSVLNVGAGTGNYEPTDVSLIAVDANSVMISQRSSPAPVVQSFAEFLPFADNSFDAALAMFTIHHWTDRNAGIRELGRVSRRQVALVYDSSMTRSFWLAKYFDALAVEPAVANPSALWIDGHLQLIEERVMTVPANCTDGFAGCYWNRPERYLDPVVQAGMSVLARLPEADRVNGSNKLADALESGDWDRQYGHLRELDEFDMGYRLVICGSE